MCSYRKLGCVYSQVHASFASSLCKRYGLFDVNNDINAEIDLLIVVGGDGLMLHSLHNHVIDRDISVYGINLGTVGFLLNQYSEVDLLEKIDNAVSTNLVVLRMETLDINDNFSSSFAINEISLFRSTHQASNLRIYVNGALKMNSLVGDGILLSTPAGSTAYNFSAGGVILPLSSNVLSLKTINPFRPRRWCGAILPSNSVVEVEVISPRARPVTAVSDYTEFYSISKIKMYKDSDRTITLLFDPNNNLEEKIITEQFVL